MPRIIFCGCGAVGSWTAMLLAGTMEFEAILIDDDIVAPENLATTPYLAQQQGQKKTRALGILLHRKGVLARFTSERTLDKAGMDLAMTKAFETPPKTGRIAVLDTFDSGDSRLLTGSNFTLHAGISEGRIGSVVWDDRWTGYPGPRGENPVCTHHLGAQIIQVTAVLAASSIRALFTNGERVNYPIIFEDGRTLQ